ncbi:MAG: transketolase [archaeon]
MGIIDKDEKESFISLDGLVEKANLMRGYALTAICAAKSGHPGGSLSIMDIAAALYLNVLQHQPSDPDWEFRDRVVWGGGHKAPAFYAALGMSGYFNIEDMASLRKFGSPFQGHPNFKLPGVEIPTGSLGQGLSDAVGMALAARQKGQDHKVYCIMGDGEQQEGQVWEAAMEASHYKLNNLIAVIDKNGLQIDGKVCDVMNIDPLEEKYRSFGWHVINVDGHDMKSILNAFSEARKVRSKPVAIIADTVKGKGVSFMENQAGWHGKAPNYEELKKALAELGLDKKIDYDGLLKLADDFQKKATVQSKKGVPILFSGGRDSKYGWNVQKNNMCVSFAATKAGFGKALCDLGDDPRIICLGTDISNSIEISGLTKDHPERKDRFLSMGIAEQSAMGVAAGLAKEGYIVFIGSYATFVPGRALDQMRTTVCYGNLNVKVIGGHAGISVGPDGATHQALEDLFQTMGLPNLKVFVPCDYQETMRAVEKMIKMDGPCYLRIAREPTPVVTGKDTPYQFSTANIIRFRGEQPNFMDAFETRLSTDYKSEREKIAIVACGPMVPEAMRAAWILEKEYRLGTRVINMHSMKPMEHYALVEAARDCEVMVTAEEHQKGALANSVAGIVLKSGLHPMFGSIGVRDRFGESGTPTELFDSFGLSTPHIVQKAVQLYSRA